MNTGSSENTKAVENRGEQGARTTDDDFTGERRDSEKNTTNQPSNDTDAGTGTSQSGTKSDKPEAELGHS